MGNRGQVTRLAATQGGYITRKQLFKIGLSANAITHRISTGELDVVSSGVYQVFPPENHIDQIRGAVLALPDAVASHESAAHLLELPRLPQLEPTVTVPSHTTHRFPNVMVRRNDDITTKHITKVKRVRVTTVARTLFDLAGTLEFKVFESVAEAAILSNRVATRHLEAMLNELARRGKPGSRPARAFLTARSAGNAQASKLEILGRRVLNNGGLPRPVHEHPVPWDRRRRFDDAYSDVRLAIEWDSRAWHAQRDAMTADRRRDREAATHGWLVVRFTWEEVTKRPEEVVATVSSLLERRR